MLLHTGQSFVRVFRLRSNHSSILLVKDRPVTMCRTVAPSTLLLKRLPGSALLFGTRFMHLLCQVVLLFCFITGELFRFGLRRAGFGKFPIASHCPALSRAGVPAAVDSAATPWPGTVAVAGRHCADVAATLCDTPWRFRATPWRFRPLRSSPCRSNHPGDNSPPPPPPPTPGVDPGASGPGSPDGQCRGHLPPAIFPSFFCLVFDLSSSSPFSVPLAAAIATCALHATLPPPSQQRPCLQQEYYW